MDYRQPSGRSLGFCGEQNDENSSLGLFGPRQFNRCDKGSKLPNASKVFFVLSQLYNIYIVISIVKSTLSFQGTMNIHEPWPHWSDFLIRFDKRHDVPREPVEI